MKKIFIFIYVLLFCTSSWAKIDLVTLPKRDKVQLTIYNSANLTLVRDNRFLTLKEGINKLEFSWANTLIDPTSLDLLPKKHIDKIDIHELAYPPRVKNLGIWKIQTDISDQVPMEINYLTSGLSWRAFYLGTLSSDEKNLLLQGFVRVTNSSGEDYENAEVRLLVGKVNIIDEIYTLATRSTPFGFPKDDYKKANYLKKESKRTPLRRMKKAMTFAADNLQMEAVGMMDRKEIKKEGLSEYFLYTIEGTETIKNNWSKRLPSFETEKIPVKNLYKYEEQRYGKNVIRFLSFKNDKEHNLGQTPIPGGAIKIFRNIPPQNNLSYEGQSDFKYIPIDQKIELNLGSVDNVIVEPTLMNEKTTKYHFDKSGNIDGYNTIKDFTIKVKNTRNVAIKIEITRNFSSNAWDIKNDNKDIKFEKVDFDTVKYTLELKPYETKKITYTLTMYSGVNAEKR